VLLATLMLELGSLLHPPPLAPPPRFNTNQALGMSAKESVLHVMMHGGCAVGRSDA
jgi:hypothetical protein